jgi:membrane protein DedA with SNARE-associated domain
MIGMGRISTVRFMILNAGGALVWAIVISSLGFLCGATAETFFRNARKIEGWIALTICGVAAAVWVTYFMRKKRAGAK